MKAIFVDTAVDAMNGSVLDELLDWAHRIGLNTKTSTTRFLLVDEGVGWRGYFGLKRQVEGRDADYIDQVTHRLAVDYDHSIWIGEPNWPDWFPDVVEVPDVPPAQVLNLWHAATDARNEVWQMANRRRALRESVWAR
jgi:hypothetical protein